jgi:anti-sigma regulatory factor (Ser/Thr protein kinase)
MKVLLAQAAPWQQSSRMPPVGALPTAAGMARMRVRLVLAEWQVDDDTAGDLELIVSELVTNAVNASTGDDGRPLYGLGGRVLPVQVRLYSDGRRLLAEVWDEAPGKPRPCEAGEWEEHGRGLTMIRQLGAEWGWCQRGNRKCVWAEMSYPATIQGTS